MRAIEISFAAVGLALLGHWFANEADVRAFQARESRRLEAARVQHVRAAAGAGAAVVSGDGSGAAAPAKHAGAAGERAPLAASSSRRSTPHAGRVEASPATAALAPVVLGRIEIPRLGISSIIVEGADEADLRRAVGHVPSTAPPGGEGNCALAGHRDSFLRGLRNVRTHDRIRIVTPQATYEYKVAWAGVVEPHATEVLRPTARPALTLVTCYPFQIVGPAPERFVVRARPLAARGAEAAGKVGLREPEAAGNLR